MGINTNTREPRNSAGTSNPNASDREPRHGNTLYDTQQHADRGNNEHNILPVIFL